MCPGRAAFSTVRATQRRPSRPGRAGRWPSLMRNGRSVTSGAARAAWPPLFNVQQFLDDFPGGVAGEFRHGASRLVRHRPGRTAAKTRFHGRLDQLEPDLTGLLEGYLQCSPRGGCGSRSSAMVKDRLLLFGRLGRIADHGSPGNGRGPPAIVRARPKARQWSPRPVRAGQVAGHEARHLSEVFGQLLSQSADLASARAWSLRVLRSVSPRAACCSSASAELLERFGHLRLLHRAFRPAGRDCRSRRPGRHSPPQLFLNSVSVTAFWSTSGRNRSSSRRTYRRAAGLAGSARPGTRRCRHPVRPTFPAWPAAPTWPARRRCLRCRTGRSWSTEDRSCCRLEMAFR